MKLLSSTALACCVGHAALAGGIVPQEPQVEIMPAPVAPVSAWDGFYTGLSYGQHYTYEPGPSNDDYDMSNPVIGAFAGYRHVLSNSITLGVEVAFSRAEGVQEEVNGSWTGRYESTYFDVRASAGYDFGRALVSGFIGWTHSNYDWQDADGVSFSGGDGDDHNGYHLGVSVDYLVTENIFAGIEYVYRDLPGEDGNPYDVEDQSIALRIGILF